MVMFFLIFVVLVSQGRFFVLRMRLLSNLVIILFVCSSVVVVGSLGMILVIRVFVGCFMWRDFVSSGLIF